MTHLYIIEPPPHTHTVHPSQKMKFTAALVALACGLTTLDAAQYIVTTNKARGVNSS